MADDEIMTDLGSEEDQYVYEDVTDQDDLLSHHYDVDSWPKFQGTPEEYFKLIQDVVDSYEQLMQLEGEDLKTHLLNLHGLKTLHYTKPRVLRARNWDRKARWRCEDRSSLQSRYTTWPQEPVLVPKKNERFVGLPQTVLTLQSQAMTSEKPKPSEGFHQEVLAEVQRQARERFYQRDSVAINGPHRSARQVSVGALAAKQSAPDRRSAHITSTSPAVNNSLDVHRDSTSNAEKLWEATESSQDSMDIDSPSRNLQRKSEVCSTDDFPPSIMLDEDRTHAVARPVVRSIVQMSDKLLNGLARMRKNHIPPNGYECSGESSAEATSLGASPDFVGSPSNSTKSGTESASEYQNNVLKHIQPMDWSEVLGIASLLGCDEKTVARAHQRCQTIFQETMRFHQMKQQVKDCKGHRKSAGLWPEVNVTAMSERISRQDEPDLTRSPDLQGRGRTFYCPEITCKHFNRPFRSITLLSTHVQHMHGYLYELGPPHGKSNLPEWMVELEELCCPFKSCESNAKDFPSNWRLMEHMKRKHRVEPRKISATRRKKYTLRQN